MEKKKPKPPASPPPQPALQPDAPLVQRLVARNQRDVAASIGESAAKTFSWTTRRLPWLALGATAGAIATILLVRRK